MKHLISAAIMFLLSLAAFADGVGYRNPIINADVPDISVCRAGDTYYMVSTTMHLMPGAPVMKSKDFKHWETISYVFPRIDDGDRYNLIDGKTAYGQGQWAASIRYVKGKFYVWFTANGEPYKGFIYTADKAEGPWTLLSRPPHFHDGSLFFDDDGKAYIFYGNQDGDVVELNSTLDAPVRSFKTHVRDGIENGLLEGSNMIKHDGKYYLLMISWPRGGKRREVCYRADNIEGPYTKKIILDSALPPFGGGVAQGTIIDTPDGNWLGMFFQDRNGIGRTPCIMPCRWEDGWPVLGIEGKVPDDLSTQYIHQTGILGSDEFDSQQLSLYWQWNHNPIDDAWSLTSKPGALRLTTARIADNLFVAPNTITQRMEGPKSFATVSIDISKMKDGDRCGFTAFNGTSGVLNISKEGRKYYLEMQEQHLTLNRQHAVEKVDVKTMERLQLKKKKIYLRIYGDFTDGRDIATFAYSLNGRDFTSIGGEVKMPFDLSTFFMGTKFAIFNYATKQLGGYIDVDWFHYNE